MDDFKEVKLDSQDIGILMSFWLYLGFILGKDTIIGGRNMVGCPPTKEIAEKMFLNCGNDCFKNIERIFNKHRIPKEYAYNCHVGNMEDSGIEITEGNKRVGE